MGILEIIFLCIFWIALPLGQLLPIEIGNSIRISWLDGGIGILLVTYAILFIKRGILFPSFSKQFLLFTGIAVLSLFFASFQLRTAETLASLLYLVRWIAYFCIIFPFLTTKSSFQRQTPLLLYISGVLLLAIGYVQYFLFPSLRGLTYEGWDPHLYRMFGSFLDPNFLGSFLSITFLLGVELFFQQKNKKLQLLIGAINTFMLLGVILSFSRGSYVALFFGLSCYVLLKGYKKWFVIVIATLLVFGALSLALLTKQSEGTNLLRTASTAARIGNMERAISIIKDAPILGVGFNAYRYAQHRKGFIGGEGWESSHSGGGVNNSYLFVMATTGIIGFIAFLYLLRTLFKKSMQSKSVYAICFVAVLVAICINSLFENTFFFESILFWIWILSGFIESKSL